MSTSRLLAYIAIVIIATASAAYDLGFRRARKKYEVPGVFQIDPETGQGHVSLQKGQTCLIQWDAELSARMAKTGNPGPLKAIGTREHDEAGRDEK